MRGKCECSLRIRLTGDGCRYCQPQGYIDMLLEQIDEEARQPSTGAQPAAGAEAWQPIETAPRNRSLLLCVAGTPVPIYCGRYRTGNLGEPQPSQAAWRCDSSGRFANPTHWQPLPAPPVAAHSGKGEMV